jgi:Xaa-Pro aminopeptidase
MSLHLPTQDAQAFSRRRQALAEQLSGTPALVFSGGYKARNYRANVHAYRADSHFLYLAGAALPDAVLVVGEAGSELFMEPPADDDSLWHGEIPGWEEIARRTGVDRVRPLSELGDVVKAAGGTDKVATLPSADPLTRAKQREWLGRRWNDGTEVTDDDARLADAMIALRMVHDAAALEQLRRASEGTQAAHLAGMAATRPGMLEHEVRAAMEVELIRRGMCPAYGSIVTVHGEVLHNVEYDHRVEDGDLLLADVGAEHDGWAGDVTRTWPANGKYSPTQRALYEIVLQAEVEAIEMVRPGVRYRDVHLKASTVLAQGLVDEGILKGDPESLVERGAHALLFPHGVGHLIGLDVHDMEDLGDRAGYAPGRERSTQFGLGYLRLDRDLQAGMMVTIEPGLYLVPAILANEELCGPFTADGTLDREALARFSDVRGIRIEDDVLCTENGPDVLTKGIPKQIADVEAQVGSGA